MKNIACVSEEALSAAMLLATGQLANVSSSQTWSMGRDVNKLRLITHEYANYCNPQKSIDVGKHHRTPSCLSLCTDWMHCYEWSQKVCKLIQSKCKYRGIPDLLSTHWGKYHFVLALCMCHVLNSLKTDTVRTRHSSIDLGSGSSLGIFVYLHVCALCISFKECLYFRIRQVH